MTHLIPKGQCFDVIVVNTRTSDECEDNKGKGNVEKELKCVFADFNKYQTKVLLRNLKSDTILSHKSHLMKCYMTAVMVLN
jgi:hypothetical protein